MKHNTLPSLKFTLRLILCLACLSALLLLASRALAGVEAFNLPWWTVDSGGGVATGGNFALTGSIGQPDAGNMSGGSYKLTGGFLAGPAGQPAPYKLYLPLTFKP